MPANKIVRCIVARNLDGVDIPAPEDGREIHPPVFIREDRPGELWYWDEPEEPIHDLP